MTAQRYTIGVDFGTASGRALVVRVGDGAELASAVTPYAHGVMDRTLPGRGPAPDALTPGERSPGEPHN